MAVTGVFQADFASFYDAVQKAEVQLRSFDSGAAKVESTLSRMTDRFSGRQIISEATLMAEVFERSGGAARFTEAELARMGATGAEAVAKMKALGQDVPASLQRMTTAAEGARPAVGNLSTTYRQFDGVLQAAGINIGPQVKGLEDIAATAGKSAGSVGALGTAGLALGAGMAGWGIGRMIAELTGLDKHVEAAWRSLLNLGDVAAQTAGAKMDTINRAIAMGADANIRYKEAVEFVTQATKRDADAKIDWTQKLADAHRELRGLSESTKNDIDIATKAGATQEQLTHKFGLSALALKVLADRQKEAAQAAEEHRQKAEELDKAYAKLNSQIANERGLAQMEAEAAAMKQAAEQRAMFEEQDIKARIRKQEAANSQAAAEAAAEEARVAANQKEIDGLMAASAAHEEAATVATTSAAQTVQGYQGIAQQITLTGDAVREWINLMRYTAQANAILSENSLFTTTSQRQRIADLGFPSSPAAPNLPASAPLSSGSGSTFNNTFQIVDTESNIARRVSDNIMRQVKAGTQL